MQLDDFFAELRPRITGDLRTDIYNRTLYSTDASIYRQMPYGVLLPKTTEDVHAAVELAAKHGVPVLPRTGGSSLAGQAVNEALVIDMTRHLNAVLEFNTDDKWVRVQPGLVLDELNLYLRPHGLQFGPDPASSNRAAMGGIVSNNSTGSHSIVYGMTADHVQATNVILSDGSTATFESLNADQLAQKQNLTNFEGMLYRNLVQLVQNPAHQERIRTATPRHWRRCGGYNLDRLVDGCTFHTPRPPRFNLADLVCGAEGGFAVMTDVTLNLVPVPQRTALAVIHFDDLFKALTAVSVVLEVGPSAVELLDHLGLSLCRGVPQYARLLDTFIEGDPNCLLITEFYGTSQAELRTKIDRLKAHLKQQGVGTGAVVAAFDPQQQSNVWTVRKVGLGLLMSIKGDHKPIPFIEDAAVPVEHLAEYVTKIENYCTDRNIRVAYYAHASAGCLHIRPLINTKAAEEIRHLPEIISFAVDLLKGYGGSLSSEHGDGRARSWANAQFFGPELYRLYQQTKHTFDPQGILNPGAVVNAGPMTENLRYGPNYQVVPLELHLDFSKDQGFDRAVEMCNGAGICRKRTTGTMCPSFMATREEEHSTRGRANLLRAALSGALPDGAFTGSRLYEAMDLCIACKACKAECPSSVDMAKIKFEYLAQYHKANGAPLRARTFGQVARQSRLSSGALAPLVNRSLNSRPMRALLEKTLGITPMRPLPTFARQPFTTWFKKHKTPKTGKQVVLFNDTFNTYNTPEVSIAATELLEAAGYEVVLPGHGCCGRPMMSKGLFDEARAAALDTVVRLALFAKQGIPIVGLEPSCLLSFRDEYHSLLPGDIRVEQVAAQSMMLEEFLAREAEAGTLNLTFTDTARHLLLHGHCHQKALVGTGPSKQSLTLPPQYTLEEVDSSCCGMAGSFGYEKEHYDLSMQMAERRLLPAVRAAEADTVIVAAGFSCRHQIEHGAGRLPLHPAQVLREALVLPNPPK